MANDSDRNTIKDIIGLPSGNVIEVYKYELLVLIKKQLVYYRTYVEVDEYMEPIDQFCFDDSNYKIIMDELSHIQDVENHMNYMGDDVSDFKKFLMGRYSNVAEWKTIEELDCSNKYLKSLDGIELLTNLKELNCSYNNLMTLKGIDKLKKLEVLKCAGNNLYTLSNIKGLKKINYINCRHNNFAPDIKIDIVRYCYENNIKVFI